ncbi:hypothetical protein [Bifidobacterium breve]|uniref:hypothetical protein n=1 Tax=Bifidobacterium breve TaxID=1685 RepID=UPI0018987137|nr:hypothetical protein [Bifidobacterium breve]
MIAEPLSLHGVFRTRVVRLAQVECGKVPRSQSVTEAIEAMQGEAVSEAGTRPVHLRIAQTSGKVWIDLLDAGNNLVCIEDGDWKVVDRTAFGVPTFRRSPAMKPLPLPKRTDNWRTSLQKLWDVVNVPEEYRPLVVAWMVHCIIHENATYPILLFQAEQGSGKSWTLRIVCGLIDPSRDTGGALPANEDAFAIAALNSRLLPFDNISTIPPSKRDLLCKTATGGAVRRRKLYTDATEGIYNIKRPIAITGINIGTTAPDLAERILRVELKRPADSERKSVAALGETWRTTQGEVYGALLTLAALVKQRIDNHEDTVAELPRMADFGLVLAAIDSITRSHTLDMYRAQQNGIAIETVSDEPLVLALEASILKYQTVISVKSSELLKQLQPLFEPGILETEKTPPKSAVELTRMMDVCAPSLRQLGWTVTSRKGTGRDSGSRVWSIKAPAIDDGVSRSDFGIGSAGRDWTKTA